MAKKKRTAFQEETIKMFLESASWNDYPKEYYKNVTIERFWTDYIPDGSTTIYTTPDHIDHDECGNFYKWGTTEELCDDFNAVRDMLWQSGILEEVYDEHQELDYDQTPTPEDFVYECCQHCEHENEFIMEMRYQRCKKCGRLIKPCAVCDHDKVNCENCPLGKDLKNQ